MGRVLRVVVPLLVVAGGGAVMMLLLATRPAPPLVPPDLRGTLVEVVRVSARTEKRRVVAQGTVIPANRVSVQPEVTGRIVAASKELVPGGLVRKGQALLRIDARDYSLSVTRERANLDRARLELDVEKSRTEIAKEEWRTLGKDPAMTPEGRALALREPHLRVAEANVGAAKSALGSAGLKVGRTQIVAPFNAVVIDESVDVGQVVGPGAPLAILVGTDRFWVQVTVPIDQLRSIDVPGRNGTTTGADSTIAQDVGGTRVERHGRVLRMLGDVDPVGRMARLLVEIDDPLGLAKEQKGARGAAGAGSAPGAERAPPEEDFPMLLGSYVHVEMKGRELEQVFEVPRAVLHDGDRVHVFGAGEKLEIRKVSVLWRAKDTLLVRGLDDGDRVVTSRIGLPVPGLALRLAEPATAASSAAVQR